MSLNLIKLLILFNLIGIFGGHVRQIGSSITSSEGKGSMGYERATRLALRHRLA